MSAATDALHLRENLARAQAALALATRRNLLDNIAWSRKTEHAFFANDAGNLPEVTYSVDRHGLGEEMRALQAAEASIVGGDEVATWLRAQIRSLHDRNRMLLALGTREFSLLSKEIYGSASSKFFGSEFSHLDLAQHLEHRIAAHGTDHARDEAACVYGAEEFAKKLRQRIRKIEPGIEIRVRVDSKCTSKVIAGMTKVRVREDATFTAQDLEALYCHEIETHAFSAQNGALQEHAPFLQAGGPRATATQEGLAVFGELYNGHLGIERVARLALRVKLVGMAESGASFLDLYRHLLGLGLDKREAYLDAARICRGGLVSGGAPFTKDAAYLAGLLHVYAFLSVYVRGGFRDEVELLLAGRIHLDDVGALLTLQRAGLLARPKYRPRWLQNWSTLLPYFAFASFMGGVDLRPVEQHYAHLLQVSRAS
jgi:uncharacterized protein (TIGR02421 family)